MRSISVRLALFNLLVVFLPVAGVLALGFYEQRLEQTQIDSMQRQGSIVVGILQGAANPAVALQNVRFGDERIRIVDPAGRVVADTGPLVAPEEQTAAGTQSNWLYRATAAVFRKPLQWIRPFAPPLASSDTYEQSSVLHGPEILTAFLGQTGVTKRVSSAPGRPVTIYTALPVYRRGNVVDAVLVSQTTDDIRQDLYAVRLAIAEIFLASVFVAVVLTLLVSTTIVQPLRQLRKEAGEIADQQGRLHGSFKGSGKRDEIGDLSRALERLTRSLEERQKSSDAFVSALADEVPNPLSSIRAATEMLAQVDDPGERARYLQQVETEIARMEKLLAQSR